MCFLILPCRYPEADRKGAERALTSLREAVPSTRHSNDVKRAFNDVARCLKLEPLSYGGFKEEKRRRKNSVENGDGENGGDVSKKKGKKKKKNKGGNKEGKKFALEEQFAGMEMPSFAGVALTDNLNFRRKVRNSSSSLQLNSLIAHFTSLLG